MPIHRIEQLTGLELNSVNGVNQSPDRLFNLVNDRFGGYIPYGIDTPVAQSAPGFLLGWDTTGKSSFNDNSANHYFALFNGVDAPTTSTVAIPSSKAVHLPGAGGFSRRDAFYLYGFDSSGADKIWTPPASTEYTDITIEEIEGNLPEGPYYIMTVTFFNTLAGSVCVGYTSPDRTIFTADEKGLKVTAPAMSDGLYMNVYIIAPDQGPPLSLYPAIFTGTLQSGEDTEIKELPLLRSIGSYGSFVLVSFKRNPVSHQGSLFGQLSELPERYSKRGANIDLSQLDIDTTMVWTDPGWANLASPRNFIKFTPTQSTKVTGYVSTPGSLLVFMENEAYRLVGTSNRDFTVQPFPVPIGCDENLDTNGRNMSAPVLLGSTPFVIWNGKVFAVDFGNVVEISKPVWDPSDPFEEIGVDIRTTDLVLRTAGNSIYRFNPEYQHWSDNVISGDTTGYGDTAATNGGNAPDDKFHFLSHPDADGIRYVTFDGIAVSSAPAEPAADADEVIEPVPAIVEEEPASDDGYGSGSDSGGSSGGGSTTIEEAPASPEVVDRPDEVLYTDYDNILFDFDPNFVFTKDAGESVPEIPELIQGASARALEVLYMGTYSESELPVTPYTSYTISDATYDPDEPDEDTVLTTSVAHDFETHDEVVVSGATGNTNINGDWRIQKLSTTTFYMYDPSTGSRITSNGVLGGTPVVSKHPIRHVEWPAGSNEFPSYGAPTQTILNSIGGVAGITIALVGKTTGSIGLWHPYFCIADPSAEAAAPIGIFYNNTTTGTWTLHASPREGDSTFLPSAGNPTWITETATLSTPNSDTWRVAVFTFDFVGDSYKIYYEGTSASGTVGVSKTFSTAGLSPFADIGGYNHGPSGANPIDPPDGRDGKWTYDGTSWSQWFYPTGGFARMLIYKGAMSGTDAAALEAELTSRYL